MAVVPRGVFAESETGMSTEPAFPPIDLTRVSGVASTLNSHARSGSAQGPAEMSLERRVHLSLVLVDRALQECYRARHDGGGGREN